jgi:hypothetical protein
MTGSSKANPIDPLLSTKETAKLLNVSQSWLAKSRLKGTGPLFVKLEHGVKYAVSAVQDYIRARTRRSTSER